MRGTKRRRRRRKRTRRKRKRRKRSLKWKYDICSPTKEQKGDTCYSSESLLKMRDAWNLRHPDVRIATNNPRQIWSNLRYYMRNTCKRESCWLRQEFIKKELNKEMSDYTFAPKPTPEWKKKPKEWLTSVDLLKVMKQFEKK